MAGRICSRTAIGIRRMLGGKDRLKRRRAARGQRQKIGRELSAEAIRGFITHLETEKRDFQAQLEQSAAAKHGTPEQKKIQSSLKNITEQIETWESVLSRTQSFKNANKYLISA